MNLLKRKLDFFTLLKYLSVAFMFFIIAFIESTPSIYALAPFTVFLDLGYSVIISSILLLLSFLAIGKIGLIPTATITIVVLSIARIIYKKFNVKPKYQSIGLLALALLVFVFMGDTKTLISYEQRVFSFVLTLFLSVVFKSSFTAVTKKGLKYKFSFEEYSTLSVSVVVIGLGICNFLSADLWKAFSIIAILLVSYLYKTGNSTLIATVLGISLSLYSGNLGVISVFLIWSVTAESLMKVSRFLSAIAVVISDYVIQMLFAVYPVYNLMQFAFTSAGAIVFCAIPSISLVKLKEKLYVFREKQLIRESINRNRIMTSNRLYELSNVFLDVKNAFISLKKSETSDQTIKSIIEKDTISNVCVNCDNKEKCKEKKNPKKSDIERLIDIGFAKGKVSFVDVPSGILETCVHPNNLLFFINKSLADFRSKKIEELNHSNGREIIAMQAEGVSDILKRLAFETGTLLKYHNKIERTLADEFYKNGLIINEILVYGDEDKKSVGIIVEMPEYPLDLIRRIISKTLAFNVVLFEKADISPDKVYLSFKKSPTYDAVFGLATAIKDGSLACGDTHSIIRISEDKFLVAVSDGMGSGTDAKTVSTTSLSLIESFYKAGLSSSVILSTVNKLLALNLEDTFTALDISVIDLKNGNADFIKYGSPYGFIVSENKVKIVEGSSLPLGILEDLSPSVCSTKLKDGDIVILISDGISDAFSSSVDIIDFLRTAPAFNPQALADELLNKAVENNGGKKLDDMTVLAVRIYQSQNIA